MITIVPSGGDDTAAVQAAINTFVRGGELVLAAGDWNLSATLQLKAGVLLSGEGVPGYANAPTSINWTGGAAPMIKVQGPFDGWGVRRMRLKGNSVGWGLDVAGASFGDCEDLCFAECVRSIAGAQAGSGPGSISAAHNSFRNTFILMPPAAPGFGINLGGDRSAGGTGNACFWKFDNTLIAMAGAVSGFGIYLAQCDTNLFVGTHICNGQTGGTAVNFDYGAGGFDQPNANGFVGLDVGGPQTQFANGGSPPNGMAPNWIVGLEGNGSVIPAIAGLVVYDSDHRLGGTVLSRSKNPSTGEAGQLLAANRTGATVLSQVKLGATNSGGSGKRTLVIDN